jgi:hypothetical protein
MVRVRPDAPDSAEPDGLPPEPNLLREDLDAGDRTALVQDDQRVFRLQVRVVGDVRLEDLTLGECGLEEIENALPLPRVHRTKLVRVHDPDATALGGVLREARRPVR